MKLVSSLLLASVVLFAGCNTNATRRDLYSPAKGDGPYSRALADSSYRYGVKQPTKKKSTTPAPAKTQPASTVPASSTSTPPAQ